MSHPRRMLAVVSALVVLPAGMLGAASSASSATIRDLDASASSKACTPLPYLGEDALDSSGRQVASGSTAAGHRWRFRGSHGGEIVALSPPDGFDASRASDVALEAFGIPRRPAEATARANWDAAWKRVLRPKQDRPTLCLTQDEAASYSSPNWSGRVDISGGFTSVSGTFRIPTFYATCAHNSSHVIWAGIGGWFNDSKKGLLQAGISPSQDGVNDVFSWFEVWPRDSMVRVDRPGVNVGDSVGVAVNYSSSGGGTVSFTISDWTNGDARTYQQSGVSAYYDGRTVEWVDERPRNKNLTYYVDDHYYYYRKSGTTYWSDENANGHAANYWNTNGVYMRSDSANKTLATAGLTSGTTSAHYWGACP